MTPARWQAVEELFHSALEQELHERGAFLDRACGGDVLLRGKVETLILSHQRAGGFIETAAAGLAVKLVEDSQAELLIGHTLGHYKIDQRIAAGGMGDVYRATDIAAGREAALKILPKRFTGDAGRLRRFKQEARAVVALNHPNILTVYEVGEEQSVHYIASELIEGATLRERLARGPIATEEALDLAIQVASALATAHTARIVHRDIKPENIMLRPDGYVKVLDFGIAKLAEQELPVSLAEETAVLLAETNAGSILGTACYMSPEQAHGGAIDQRTDIWSLGVVLYEMLAGAVPFSGDTPIGVMNSILKLEPALIANSGPTLPRELQQLIAKALQKERDDRYQSAEEFLAALKAVRRQLEFTDELKRSMAEPSSRRWMRSRKCSGACIVSNCSRPPRRFRVARESNRQPATGEKHCRFALSERKRRCRERLPRRRDSRRCADEPRADSRAESHQPHQRDGVPEIRRAQFAGDQPRARRGECSRRKPPSRG